MVQKVVEVGEVAPVKQQRLCNTVPETGQRALQRLGDTRTCLTKWKLHVAHVESQGSKIPFS